MALAKVTGEVSKYILELQRRSDRFCAKKHWPMAVVIQITICLLVLMERRSWCLFDSYLHLIVAVIRVTKTELTFVSILVLKKKQ